MPFVPEFGRLAIHTEIGRRADLDTQIRCAPVRPALDVYAQCLGAVAIAPPDAGAAEPAAGPASGGPVGVERIGPDVAADDFEQFLREIETLGAAPSTRTVPPTDQTAPADTNVARTIPEPPAAPSTWTAPRQKPTIPATVARTIPKAPAVAVPERATRVPLCAGNGSCYGDISSYTGRPKKVHVSGYYRKDGTYVRGHYRSRPRR